MTNTSPAPEKPSPEALKMKIASLKAKLKAGWRSGSSADDGDALCAELTDLEADLDRFAAARVETERERCLRVLKMNNDNDAHRYYIEHPEFFK